MLVVGTAVGAFVISFFTPTVGLGCRTGGYIVFISISMGLLLSEILVWVITSPIRNSRVNELIEERLNPMEFEEKAYKERKVNFPGLAASKATFSMFLKVMEHAVVLAATTITRLNPEKQKQRRLKRVEDVIRHHFAMLQSLTTRQWSERAFFAPVEFINTVWLLILPLRRQSEPSTIAIATHPYGAPGADIWISPSITTPPIQKSGSFGWWEL